MKPVISLIFAVAAVFALGSACADTDASKKPKTESANVYGAVLATNAENLLNDCIRDNFVRFDDKRSGAETVGKALALVCYKELENIIFVDCLNSRNKQDAKACEEKAKGLSVEPTMVFMYVTNRVLQLRAKLQTRLGEFK